MRKVTLLIPVVTISLASCAMDVPAGKVPSVIENTLQSKFPNATKMDWEKKGELYEVEFNMNNVEYMAYLIHRQNW